MDPTQVLSTAASLVATLFGMLVLILGWLGNKIYSKLDSVEGKINVMATELHTRINNIDTRVTKIETRCDYEHNGRRTGDSQ